MLSYEKAIPFTTITWRYLSIQQWFRSEVSKYVGMPHGEFKLPESLKEKIQWGKYDLPAKDFDYEPIIIVDEMGTH